MVKSYKILWLSDIHYQTISDTSKLGKMFKNLNKFITEIKDIDMCIISGDIVMNGGVSKYYTEFFQQIKFICDTIPVVAIPGNHDLRWKNAEGNMLERPELINEIKNLKTYSKFKEKIEGLAGTSYDYNLFGFFEREFNNTLKETLKSKYNNRFLITEIGNYLSNYLVYDKLYNVVYVLINSAWMSLSNPIAKVQKEDYPSYEENGNQFYFSETVEERLEAFLQDNKISNAFKILVAHHPPSWIHWTERYSAAASEQSPIEMLLDHIDLVLVGHEHTQPMAGDFVYGKSLMMRGLRLMHHSIRDGETDISNNGFKLLEISHERIIHETSYNYTDSKWKEHGRKFTYDIPNIQHVFGKKSTFQSLTVDDVFMEGSSFVNVIDNPATFTKIWDGIFLKEENGTQKGQERNLHIVVLNRKSFTPDGIEKLTKKMLKENTPELKHIEIELQESLKVSVWHNGSQLIEELHQSSNNYLARMEHDLYQALKSSEQDSDPDKPDPNADAVFKKCFFKNKLMFDV
ncbi:MAG: metallophosphoesterase [Saprospiraceae bacterium]|jgi:3',5'-cyclic AMP phosphodiesterase CpdA|nr:metallophosphoesterase [Saprospiraceae bacterium]